MEIQFESKQVPCLWPVARQVQNLEETQELRVGDGMPDIGCVLGAWGQVLLRGKEWRTGQLGASFGVMVWVLYMPEDGGPVQKVETWIPFQVHWDFADSGKEGKARILCLLRSVDARSISARKLMLRAGVAASCDAEIQGAIQVPTPCQMPDVYLLKKQYPVLLPVETGEKMFTLDEELKLPGNLPEMDRLLRYELRPELIDRKVIGNKAVFRGCVILHVLYMGNDGQPYSWEFDVPFSQYTELDGEYSENAAASFWIAVTNLEVEPMEDGSLRMQCGLTGQYKIADRHMLEIAEDAYSTKMMSKLNMQQLQAPVILDNLQKTMTFDTVPDTEGGRVVDISWYPDHPNVKRDGDEVQMGFPGALQVLYCGSDGQLKAETRKLEEYHNFSADPGTDITVTVAASGKCTDGIGQNGGKLHVDALADISFTANADIAAVANIVLTENPEGKKDRPSLILRRPGREGLWELAKEAGSSVEAIMEANQLEGEPEGDGILLIPVLY